MAGGRKKTQKKTLAVSLIGRGGSRKGEMEDEEDRGARRGKSLVTSRAKQAKHETIKQPDLKLRVSCYHRATSGEIP